jgi:hypothetical protein
MLISSRSSFAMAPTDAKCVMCRTADPTIQGRFCSEQCMLAHPSFAWSVPMRDAFLAAQPFRALGACLIEHGPPTHAFCMNVRDGVMLAWFAPRATLPAHLTASRMLIVPAFDRLSEAVSLRVAYASDDGRPIPPFQFMMQMLADNSAARFILSPAPDLTLVPVAPTASA